MNTHQHPPGELPPGRKTQHRSPVSLGFLRETAIVVFAIYVYFFVRGLIDARISEALRHSNDVIAFEKAIGIFHERQFQSLILHYQWSIDLVNSIYIYGHWPIIASTLTWLFLKHRDIFRVYRTAMILSGLVGFAFFYFFPTAPPRLVEGLGLVDTVTLHSHAYRVLQPPSLTNEFAAMPSLHVGWNLLMGIAIFRYSINRYTKVFGAIMPLVMYLATVLTANHYFVDGIAGSALALSGLAASWALFPPHAPALAETALPEHDLTPLEQG